MKFGLSRLQITLPIYRPYVAFVYTTDDRSFNAGTRHYNEKLIIYFRAAEHNFFNRLFHFMPVLRGTLSRDKISSRIINWHRKSFNN